MLSHILGVMATSVIGLVSAQEELLPCGNAFYVASQYTCYAGDQLCPVENGQPTEPCGEDCYLSTMYSCNNGVLAPPLPSANGNFQLVALNSPFFDSALIEASGLVFLVGGGPPATYCPDQVAEISQCPPGTETDFSCDSGFCGLNVEVPGGQQIYVAPNGAVSYTQAHSNAAPPGSQFSGFSLEGEVLRFGDAEFYACPPADGSYTSQLYIGLPEVLDDQDCYQIELVTAPGNETGFAAWQYT